MTLNIADGNHFAHNNSNSPFCKRIKYKKLK